jgi:copper resistance protein C
MTSMFALRAAAVVAGLLAAAPAFAHTSLTSSSPAKGEVVEAPKTLVLEFGDTVKLSRVQVVPADGVAQTLAVDRKATASKQMTLEAPVLAAGPYTVKWRAIAADGHVMTGDFNFTVK